MPPLSGFFRKEEEHLVTQGLADVHGVGMFHSLYDVGDLIGRCVRCHRSIPSTEG